MSPTRVAQPSAPAAQSAEAPGPTVGAPPSAGLAEAPGPTVGAPPSAARRGRPLRADAQRNRDRLLTAAGDAFASQGVDTSLEDIARKARVGIGTLYRHFPTRDALIEAVYRRGLEEICDLAPQLLRRTAPDDALATWMQRFVGYAATKRGMAAALKSAVGTDSELFAYAHKRVNDAISSLLTAAADSGAIRADVNPQDLMRAMSGICMAVGEASLQDQARRLVALLMDGLRYGAPGAQTPNTDGGTAIPSRRSSAASGGP